MTPATPCPACVLAGRVTSPSAFDLHTHNIACARDGERVYRWPLVLARKAA